MTKKRIIILSIVLGLVTLIGVLFGAVFRLRKIEIKASNDIEITVQNADIIEASNLKIGSSIFGLDKDKAIENIEKTFAEIKVLQIKTVSLTSVEIVVRERIETFYTKKDNFYYCLDEDLKVLRKVENEPSESGLIYVDVDFNITSNTQAKDFIGTSTQQNLFSNLYSAMVSSVKVADGTRYAERADLKDLISKISLSYTDTLTEHYLVLTLQTKQGVTLNIGKADCELNRKINSCFTALQSETYKSKTTGEMRIYYNNEGTELFEFFAD